MKLPQGMCLSDVVWWNLNSVVNIEGWLQTSVSRLHQQIKNSLVQATYRGNARKLELLLFPLNERRHLPITFLAASQNPARDFLSVFKSVTVLLRIRFLLQYIAIFFNGTKLRRIWRRTVP